MRTEGTIYITYKVEDEGYDFKILDSEKKEIATIGFATYFMDDEAERSDLINRMLGALVTQIYGVLGVFTEREKPKEK